MGRGLGRGYIQCRLSVSCYVVVQIRRLRRMELGSEESNPHYPRAMPSIPVQETDEGDEFFHARRALKTAVCNCMEVIKSNQ